MNLRRQLLIVSLLTLVLPWAGCQFIRETESALREGQQAMLTGTAQAIADSLSQFPEDFRSAGSDGPFDDRQIYGHPLGVEPLVDGYPDDWTAGTETGRNLKGSDGDIHVRSGIFRQQLFLFIDVRDATPLYPGNSAGLDGDRIELLTLGATGSIERLLLATDGPGRFVGQRQLDAGARDESRVQGYWLSTPYGYRIEARVPLELIGNHLGVTVVNERGSGAAIKSSTFDASTPGRFVQRSPVLMSVVRGYARPDLRLIVTDLAGWRLAEAGDLSSEVSQRDISGNGWLKLAYRLLLDTGGEAAVVELDPRGREHADYVRLALAGEPESDWFLSAATGRNVVAVAQPVWSGNVQTGVLVLQQGTAAILSLTNAALGRLVGFTLIATLLVAFGLIGYASWLSFRIRTLSRAAEEALSVDPATLSLPSAASGDEIGDLSRSFGSVLNQLGNYNDYLRTLAAKLSHELRTPLTIVSSSLENLEHEDLSEDAARYTSRARDGTARLKKILDAMSEANRTEELMQSVEPERFDLVPALANAVEAYAATWTDRRFRLRSMDGSASILGSPELFMQMLDKLVDNAIGFSQTGDEIGIQLEPSGGMIRLSVINPGPPLPEKMRNRLFDSMVSLRPDADDEHLGLGLYIAKLIAEGHNGTIKADNTNDGVVFHVHLPHNAKAWQPVQK